MSGGWNPESMEVVLVALALAFCVLAVGLGFTGRGGRRSRRLSWLAAGSCLFILAVRSWVVEPFYVPTPSMAPTLLEGDVLLVQKYPYRLAWPLVEKEIARVDYPARGDVVVFSLPSDASTRYVKRVVGLPGDDVVLLDGRWYVNGKELAAGAVSTFDDPRGGRSSQGRSIQVERLAGRTYHILEAREPQPFAKHWKVPENEVFVLGDNRGLSMDSRDFGPVPVDRVVGRVGRLLVNVKGWDRWLSDMSSPDR